MNAPFVSVVVPLRNDADIIQPVLEELSGVLARHYQDHEIILVDDGSTDDTGRRLEPVLGQLANLRLIRLSRRFGEEAAISAGIDLSIGDYCVVLMPNTDDPRLVPVLVARAQEGIDVLIGERPSRAGEPWWRRLGASMFYAYIRRVLHLDMPEMSTQLRCLSRQAVAAIGRIRDRDRYLRLLTSYIGFERAMFPYTPRNLRGGRVGRSFRESVGLALLIVMENSAHPLRLASMLGVLIGALNVVYAGYVAAIYLFKDTVAEGWVTLSLQNALQFFLLAIMLATVCEYIGRILNRVADRPAYYIRDERASAVMPQDERRNVLTLTSTGHDRVDSVAGR